MSLQLVSVLLVSYVSLTACAVQQSSPEAGVGGLLPGRRYEYSYSSEATVYLHANISLQAKVSLQLLPPQSRRSENELLLQVSNLYMTWVTPQGEVPDVNPLGDLSNWFSLIKDGSGGRITSVYYPSGESRAVVAFKKSLSQHITVGGEVVREVREGGVHVVRGRSFDEEQRRRISVEKELRFDEMGVLISAHSNESVLQDRGTRDEVFSLFTHPISSQSALTLTGTTSLAGDSPSSRPQELVTDTVEVSKVEEALPFSELSPLISDTLRTCVDNDCQSRLNSLFRRLSSADVGTLLDRLELTADKQLVLLDSLVQSGRGSGVLGVWLSPDEDEDVVKRVLLYLATGKITPNEDFVNAALRLLAAPLSTGRGGVSTSLQHSAILSLGGMARVLTQQDPDLANQIADDLSSVLDHVTGKSSSSRLRRSTVGLEQDPLLNLTLLDSFGNSRAPRLLPLLVDHVTDVRGGSLATKHAAVRAIGRYESTESAEFLLEAAETSPYPSVRHVAGVAYSAHPRATRDVRDLLSQSPHHRSRRQLEDADSAVSNVSMPTVNWNREFGESNISVDLTRTVRNSFDIDTDPHSSRYTFSVYDETTFDANLLLSRGQENTQMWAAEICLQGTSTYDINILQDFSHNLTAYHHDRLQAVVDTLTQDFNQAYTQITTSESAYSAAVNRLLAAVDLVPSRFNSIPESLSRYQTESAGIATSELKESADELFRLLNGTFSADGVIISTSLPGIRTALADLYPSRPQDFSASLLVDSLPFTESRFLVRYLPSAPQQAMAGIFNVYRSSSAAFDSLTSSYESVRVLLEPQGVNSQWLAPLVYLRDTRTQVDVLIRRIEATIVNAGILQLSDEEVADLRLLLEAVSSHLRTTFDLAQEVGQEVIASAGELERVFDGSREGFDAFTRAYENSRQHIDSIFGQKFHPNFPRLIKSCDQSGCGHYPATLGGTFNDGVDLQVTSASVVSPLSGYVHTFNSSLLPVSVQDLYSNSNYTGTGIILLPAESSHVGTYIILSNLVPESGIGLEGRFVTSGDVIGRFQSNSAQVLHVEIIEEIDSVAYRLDPTSYLQPRLEPNVSVELECNDVVTYVGGVVVERRNLVTNPVTRQLVGDPLVVDVPDHEFPQPHNLVVMETGGAAPPGQVTFLQDSTFLMVGQIPVELDFSVVGSYQLNYTQVIGLLSKTFDLSVTPSFLARVQGSVRVGSTVFATVDLEGVMLETSLPLELRQDAASWPLTASSSMDVILAPSALNLTSQLFRLTAGGSGEPELLQTSVEWAYSIPPLNRDEFYYRGVLADVTPPLYTPLGGRECVVRQVPGRAFNNPAFEILYEVYDRESLLNYSLSVGTYEYSDDVVGLVELGGNGGVTVYDDLIPAANLFFTVEATNQNGLSSFASCSFVGEHFYDRSPPLGRINPIGQVTSHASMIRALVVLFDEVRLSAVQEIAVGRLRGVAGSDVLSWTPFNTSLIYTPPGDGSDVMQLYSFGRAGRLVTNVLQVSTLVPNVTACATLCEDQTTCLSFDFSQAEQTCVLHDGIQGPSDPQGFENIFATPELQVAGGYEHFERLGIGNSTQVEFSGLEFEHNVEYFINMRLRNELGYENVISSAGFLVDLTPPLPGLIAAGNSSAVSVFPGGCLTADVPLPGCVDPVVPRALDMLYVDGEGSAVVFNGPVPLRDARFTSDTNLLSAHWLPFHDPESGIFSYTWCVGTSPGSCDLLPHTDPHAQLRLTSPDSWTYSSVLAGLELPEGDYYITVRATNRIAYGGPLFTTVQHSTPYRVDTTPPLIGSDVDVSYNSSTNQLAVRYEASDPGGEVASVEVALGRTPLDTSVLEWAWLAADQSDAGYGEVEVDIPDGLPVWLKLRATDAAGLQSVFAAESAFIIDHTPPMRGRVYDGSTPGSDEQYQDSSAPLCVNWAGFSDPHTGLGHIKWEVRRAAGLVDARNLTADERERGVACFEGISLSHNTTYFSVLEVYNGADEPLAVSESSDGVHIDQTPPQAGRVYDGDTLGLDLDYTSSHNTLQASWTGYLDYESGLARYSISVYRQASGGMDFERIYEGEVEGGESGVTVNQLRLENGDYVLIEVTGVNGAGGYVSVNTSGVVIDLSLPELLSLVDGADANSDLQYQVSNGSITVAWDVSDSESGVSRVYLSIYELSQGRRLRVYPGNGTDSSGEVIPGNETSWSVDGLELNSGSRYVTALTIVNGAGLEAMYETDGVTVDFTPPTMLSVSVSSDAYLDTTDTSDMTVIIANPNQTEARWAGLDAESGIQHFLVGVVDENDTLVTPDYAMFGGPVSGGIIETPGLLTPEAEYRVAVVAVNGAGIESSEVAYSETFRVTEGDRAGVVIDGGMPDLSDIDFTYDVTSVTAQFYGFSSVTCGGIAWYEWAVGEGAEGAERETVLQFTSRGVTDNGDGTGHAQLPVAGLPALAGRRLYVTVRGVTDCGDTLESTSNGYTIDTTPPSLEVLATGERAIERAQSGSANFQHQTYQTSDIVSAIWSAMDTESGIPDDIMVQVGTFPGGDDLTPSGPVPGNSIRGRVTAPEGRPSYLTLTAVNGAGLESVAIGEPITMDMTPPLQGQISCTASGWPVPLSLWGSPSLPDNTGVFSCQWTGVSDPESSIRQYTVAIGTSPTDQSVMSRTILDGYADLSSFVTPPISSLDHTLPYYVVLYSTNGAGLESITISDPVYFDISPPIISGEVNVYPNFKVSDYFMNMLINMSSGVESATCLLDTDVVSITFSNAQGMDSGRSDFTYQVGIGLRPGSDDVMSYESFVPVSLAVGDGPSLYHRLHPLDLNVVGRNGIYFNVRVRNSIGHYATLTSNQVFIKSNLTMERNWIFDGIGSSFDAEYQTSTVQIDSRLFFGVNCPIRQGLWAVESVDGNLTQPYVDLIPFQYQDSYQRNTFHVTTDQVQLYNDETYRILVQATDYSGEVHILRSNGVTVTTQGLVPGLVRDGPIPEQDLNYQESVTSLSACWNGFGNGSPEQEIAYYEVAAGSDLEYTSTRSNIAPFTNVGLNKSHTFAGLELNAETQRYYVTVRAYAVSGMYVEAHSNGITVGFRHTIVPGVITLTRYQDNTDTLSAYWSDFESSLPIRQYEWALGSEYFNSDELEAFCLDTNRNFSEAFDVAGFTSIGLDTYVSLQGLELQDNTTYYLTLRVLDQAKRCITVTSAYGVTVDQTPPTIPDTPTSVTLGPVESRVSDDPFVIYIRPGMEVNVEWNEFEDLESGVDYYQVGLFRQSTCGNVSSLGEPVVDFFVAGERDDPRQAILTNVALEVGVVYVGVVAAVNQAGVTGYGFSQPVLLDNLEPIPGLVKDGVEWNRDVTYQSDLSMLSAVFTHAKLPESEGSITEPCPPARVFDLSEWSTLPTPTQLVGYASSTIMYTSAQVSESVDPLQVSITTFRDTTSSANEVLSGAYQTTVDLSMGGTFQADVMAASGSGLAELQMNSVTSVLFIDSGMANDNILAKFEPDVADFFFGDSPVFSAFGVQIYRDFANATTSLPQRVVLWANDPQTLGEPVFVRRDIPGVNLDVANTYRIEFTTERLDNDYTRSAQLYINEILVATLYGLPSLSDASRVVFHTFNRQGYVPPRIADLSVEAVFANVTLPRGTGHLCDYGAPFYSGWSPVVEFRAWAGTREGLDDVHEAMVVSSPCLPCLPGPCELYNCDNNCTSTDPYTTSLTFSNLTLSPGYPAPGNQSDRSVLETTEWFQPATYYVTVEAITASGRRFTSSSNGVTIDTTPPILTSAIEHFDVSFSREEPVVFQGNNNTISAQWRFEDRESGIAAHSWAIGTEPFATDIQDFVNVGLANGATATGLSLIHNTTYYITVVARNGAGLVANVTSEGVTYIATELNVTLLRTLVDVEFTELLMFTDERGEVFSVRRTDRDFRASVSWTGVGQDIRDISWYIGSVAGTDDILPPVNISLANTEVFTAAIDSGIILLGDTPFTNVSEVIALEEGKVQDPADNLFFFEPGRLVYHSVEFCNLVHVCTVSMGTPSIVIRGKDVGFSAIFADSASRVEVRQVVGVGVNRQTLHSLDKEYTLTVQTDRGLDVGARLYAGFLNQDDVTKTYRVLTPYISNPFLTMGLTSREIARRFTEFGGPSFYVSFLGQESLNAPLDINVTFDSSLDWDVATPEIGFWDIDTGVWREVSETCANRSRVDYTTFTIAVRVCSTVLGGATPSPNRPRQRRQAEPTNQTLSSGSGSGLGDVTEETLILDYLDRPVQFIVMRIGNISTNSAPQLRPLPLPLEVIEDMPRTIQLEYVDAEFDTVTFELLSVSKLANVTLTSDGLLTYDPCENCVGTDIIQFGIREVPIVENQIPLEAFGEIIVQVSGVNDGPLLYFYNSTAEGNAVIDTAMMSVFVDADRASPVVLASVAAFDLDGYTDDLQLVVLQDAQQGVVSFRTTLNAVNLFESLPVSLSFSHPELSEYHDYVTFLSAHVTYLPNEGFIGNDSVAIVVTDTELQSSSEILQISIEVLPSPCENNGECGGSDSDPTCEDVVQRRSSFDGYNCSCLPGFSGQSCEVELAVPEPPVVRDCPVGVPVVQCEGDPCEGATCPSHPLAQCRANFCGSCRAEWYLDNQQITCNADNISSICSKLLGDPTPIPAVVLECNGVQCPCPAQPFSCPADSVLVERRVDNCCVQYECVCPNISCPLLMEAGEAVQPVPNFRGNQFPGRCCPEYSYEDINECETRAENLCSDQCTDLQGTYSCNCPQGRTLASDQVNCGVCPYNGMEYLLGDRVKIGCNWCLCRGDDLNAERWHCTANSCESRCLSDGILHPLGAMVTVGDMACTCEITDNNGQDWMCED